MTHLLRLIRNNLDFRPIPPIAIGQACRSPVSRMDIEGLLTAFDDIQDGLDEQPLPLHQKTDDNSGRRFGDFTHYCRQQALLDGEGHRL